MPAELSLRTRRPSRSACAGRYHLVEGQKNSKGQPLNLWDVNTGRGAKVTEVESMWPDVCDLQRDFAARVQWAATPDYNKAEHEPELSIEEGTDFTAAPGEALTLTARAKSPDAGLTDEISCELPAVKTAGFGGFSTSFELPSTVSYTQMAVMRRKSRA